MLDVEHPLKDSVTIAASAISTAMAASGIVGLAFSKIEYLAQTKDSHTSHTVRPLMTNTEAILEREILNSFLL